LFINILSAASCGHPLQVILAPRGALTWRLRVLIVLTLPSWVLQRGKASVFFLAHTLKEAI
jgi:hypothetical protein